jgi:hypothetical protein
MYIVYVFLVGGDEPTLFIKGSNSDKIEISIPNEQWVPKTMFS